MISVSKANININTAFSFNLSVVLQKPTSLTIFLASAMSAATETFMPLNVHRAIQNLTEHRKQRHHTSLCFTCTNSSACFTSNGAFQTKGSNVFVWSNRNRITEEQTNQTRGETRTPGFCSKTVLTFSPAPSFGRFNYSPLSSVFLKHTDCCSDWQEGLQMANLSK